MIETILNDSPLYRMEVSSCSRKFEGVPRRRQPSDPSPSACSSCWDNQRHQHRNYKRQVVRFSRGCEPLINWITNECKKRGIVYYLITARVTQSYDAGCCIYFYFGFNCSAIVDPMECYQELEDIARDEILSSGGSLSHHHGIGKLRAKWYPRQVSEMGVSFYRFTKNELDPKNIFANGNFIDCGSHL